MHNPEVTMKANRLSISFLILLLALISSACGTLQLGVEGAQEEGAQPDETTSPPLEVLVARDTTLAYLQSEYGEQAPGSGLEWFGQETTPEGLVGSRSFRFTAESWTIQIEYPLVAPDQVTYSVIVSSSESGFAWEGTVDAAGNISGRIGAGPEVPVVAWLGHIASLPAGMSEDDVFILGTEGGMEFGLRGVDSSVEAQIAAVRDAVGQGEFVNIWGSLMCEGEGVSGCTITADRLLYGAPSETLDTVDGWEGVIYSGPSGPRSGGDDYFVLTGRYPVEYGIWSRDEGVLAELQALRDTGTVIRIFGQLMAGVPDWNNTQIQVERFEVIQNPGGEVPAAPSYPEASTREGWMVYDNERYGYQIQYPPEATLEESGIQGYPSDENGMPVGGLPEGVTQDTYFQYLEQTYGNNLCVQIRTSLGYIMISAPENAEFRYAICGRTGVGVAEITNFDLDVRANGKYYTAQGMDVQAGGESLTDHNETVRFTLEDGTRIEFGARPVADATYEDYLMKGRPLLLSILETYLSTR
jgi:hypothetical protein